MSYGGDTKAEISKDDNDDVMGLDDGESLPITVSNREPDGELPAPVFGPLPSIPGLMRTEETLTFIWDAINAEYDMILAFSNQGKRSRRRAVRRHCSTILLGLMLLQKVGIGRRIGASSQHRTIWKAVTWEAVVRQMWFIQNESVSSLLQQHPSPNIIRVAVIKCHLMINVLRKQDKQRLGLTVQDSKRLEEAIRDWKIVELYLAEEQHDDVVTLSECTRHKVWAEKKLKLIQKE